MIRPLTSSQRLSHQLHIPAWPLTMNLQLARQRQGPRAGAGPGAGGQSVTAAHPHSRGPDVPARPTRVHREPERQQGIGGRRFPH